MIEQHRLADLPDQTVYDSDGSKIGKVGQIYTDTTTGEPTWASVNTGLFGTKESFVPLHDASFGADGLTVPFSKDHVKDAPNIENDGELSPTEEDQLYRHYQIGAAPGGQTPSGEAGAPRDDAMTLSEERLDVGTRTQESGRVRLRKYVVTENVTQTVPVRREKAVLEREPITEENRDAAMAGPEITESEHEVVLHEERPVVEKTVEPVERVRVGTEEVQDQETVSEDVRREQIEAEGDIKQR
jgi:uncharacterized protein (TIGR02271 family)